MTRSDRREEGQECPEISIVIPIYRNAGTLVELYHRLCSGMEQQRSFEILFVDDSCPEDSLAVMKRLSFQDQRVIAVGLERNVGQQRAVLIGLSLARGKRVVVMDGDLQDPPEAIPGLLERMNDGFSAVFAGRRGRYESPVRLFTSRLFKRLLHLLCNVPPDAGIFVAMDRPMVDRLVTMNPSMPFLVAMIGCSGMRTTSVPVMRAPRTVGSSAFTSLKRLKSGCLAILWVLLWQGRMRHLATGKKGVEVPFRTHSLYSGKV
jgi:glycosyltransferase involved in cell wall biosynthesis